MSKLKIMIPCDEANHVCDKTQYKEATLWEKIKLTIHLAYCRACRNYTKSNRKLTAVMKDSKIQCMDESKKASMKTDFEKLLQEHKD